jgi:hypothetical protein
MPKYNNIYRSLDSWQVINVLSVSEVGKYIQLIAVISYQAYQCFSKDIQLQITHCACKTYSKGFCYNRLLHIMIANKLTPLLLFAIDI